MTRVVGKIYPLFSARLAPLPPRICANYEADEVDEQGDYLHLSSLAIADILVNTVSKEPKNIIQAAAVRA